MTANLSAETSAYQTVATAIEFVCAHQHLQPPLSDIASHLELSESHLQRLFSSWAGVSPKQYLQYLTKENAKQQLHSNSVLEAALSSGLSGSGRLHDLMINWEAVTPGEYEQQGKGLSIHYGSHPSPFGQCFIAVSRRGICKLAFYDDTEELALLENELHRDWCQAEVTHKPEKNEVYARQIFNQPNTSQQPLKILLRGSPFQIKVWEALHSISEGNLLSYQQVAQSIGSPASVRAVASAIARNNIGYLIPCHRVIRANGDFSNYRWGQTRKKALIAWEQAHP